MQKRKPTHFSKKKPGQILLVGILFMVIILILSATLFNRVADYLRFSSNSVLKDQATVLAEAGVENALWQLNKNAGTCGPSDGCGVETALGTTGSFRVTVTDKSSTVKTITATGFVPNMANPRSKKTIKADAALSTTNISFRYAVQVGDGGITMHNSSTIQGVGGTNATVFSNKTGLNSILGSGSSRIVGDAYALGSISSPDPTITGIPHQNYASPAPMPTIDYQLWKDTASAGGITDCSSTCVISANQNIGPRKFQGDLEVTSNARVTLNGPVYVTGNFKAQNQGRIILNESFGSNGTTFIVDGTVEVSNNGGFESTSANPKGYILVATPSVSNEAVRISNQGVNAIFYALEGGALLSNSARVTALLAKSLTMNNSAIMEYDMGLASAQFTSGPGGGWSIKKGTYRFTQ